MFHLEQFAQGRYDVRTENGRRAGSILGGADQWCAEVGSRVVGYYATRKLAAEAILDDQGIKGLFEQMRELVESAQQLQPAYADDFYVHDKKFIGEWACGTSLLWIVRPLGTHLCALDLPLSKREGEALLQALHPDVVGRSWQLYHIDVAALKVTEITEERARQLVSATPKYAFTGNAITAHGSPVAHVDMSYAHGYASHDRRCHLLVRPLQEPSPGLLAVLKRMAFYAASDKNNMLGGAVPASIDILFERRRLYHWTTPT